MDFTQQNQDALLQELNQFTRRTHTLDEVYLLDVLLCDNEVDRDFERFSDSALETLKTLFVGKTGIFDHDPSGNTSGTADQHRRSLYLSESKCVYGTNCWKCRFHSRN